MTRESVFHQEDKPYRAKIATNRMEYILHHPNTWRPDQNPAKEETLGRLFSNVKIVIIGILFSGIGNMETNGLHHPWSSQFLFIYYYETIMVGIFPQMVLGKKWPMFPQIFVAASTYHIIFFHYQQYITIWSALSFAECYPTKLSP